MRGTLRYRSGAWRLQAYVGTDPATGKRQFAQRTVRAPESRAGRKLAEAELRRLVDEVEAGRHRIDHDVTVAELLAAWQAAMAHDWSAGHAYQTRLIVDGRIIPKLGGLAVHIVRAHHLNAFYAELLARGGTDGKPLASATVRKVHNTLSGAFRYALESEIIATNPATAAKPPRIVETEIEPPDAGDVAAILAEADPMLYTYLRLSSTTGTRRGQLCALRWTGVDLDARELTFTHALVYGGPGVGLVEKGTKNNKRYTIALDALTAGQLERMRVTHLEQRLAKGVPADAFVFSNDGGFTPWRPDSTSKRWRALRAKVGLDGVRLHDLRHFVITQSLAAGHDPVTVAGRAGYATPNLMMRRYAHFVKARDRDLADELGHLIDGQQ